MATNTDFGLLVTTDWLAAHLGDADVKIVDASNYLPTDNRDCGAEFLDEHIPGAVFFDLEAVVDPEGTLPHAIPSEEIFAEAVGVMGIGNDDKVVIYDSSPFFSAPRCWWLFKYFGHHQAALLDGGLPKWKREGRPLESGPAKPEPKAYKATAHPGLVMDMQTARRISEGGEAQIIDARGAARFTGEDPEPRPGMKSGHIPGALNLPYNQCLAEDGTFLPADQLRQRFEDAGLNLDAPVVTSCGAGVTACVLGLGLEILGKDWRLYDGSWSQWGGHPDTPVETGPARRR